MPDCLASYQFNYRNEEKSEKPMLEKVWYINIKETNLIPECSDDGGICLDADAQLCQRIMNVKKLKLANSRVRG